MRRWVLIRHWGSTPPGGRCFPATRRHRAFSLLEVGRNEPPPDAHKKAAQINALDEGGPGLGTKPLDEAEVAAAEEAIEMELDDAGDLEP